MKDLNENSEKYIDKTEFVYENDVNTTSSITDVDDSSDVLTEEDLIMAKENNQNTLKNENQIGGSNMVNTGVIGIGNAGNQVAALSQELLNMDALAINSSEKDLLTLPDRITKILIGDTKGAGKVRTDAKKFLKDKITNILGAEDILKFMQKDLVFIVSSTGGGTGSGIAPLFSEILRKMFPDTQIILIGILPTLREALSTQVNTLEYLQELYESSTRPTYMIYDNQKYHKLPTHQMMSALNTSIVNDLEVLKGTFQTNTKYTSIDEKDMSKITGTGGRLIVFSARDIKEKVLDDKSVDELLVDNLKSSGHAEIQRDMRVHRFGIITNCSERMTALISTNMPAVKNYLGTPVEEFEHVTINDDNHSENNVFVIASGLSKINDRIRSIKDRIDEIEKEQDKFQESEDELVGINIKDLNAKREENTINVDEVDINDLFSQFGI